MTKAEKLKTRFLHSGFLVYLTNYQVSDLFINALNENDVDSLIASNVYFALTSSPASETTITSVPESTPFHLITFDRNFLHKLSPGEIVAMLLHEIGHVLYPGEKGIEAEKKADKFASDRGFKEYLISSLREGVDEKWDGFEEETISIRLRELESEENNLFKEGFVGLENE